MMDNLREYCVNAKKITNKQEPYFTGPFGNDIFKCSPSCEKNMYMFLIKIQLKNNTTPLLDWGKYWEKDVRIMVPISVQTHYSFIDGIHIGEFVDSLEKYFASF